MYVDMVYWFYGYSFFCLIGCFSMIIWTPTVLSVLYACVLYFCICTCSAQLSMFHVERRSRYALIIITIIIIEFPVLRDAASWVRSSSEQNFSGRGDFSLGINIGSVSKAPDETINQGLVCAHMHSHARTQKDPDINVLDR